MTTILMQFELIGGDGHTTEGGMINPRPIALFWVDTAEQARAIGADIAQARGFAAFEIVPEKLGSLVDIDGEAMLRDIDR